MQRDRLSILVIVAALLSIGLAGAALVAPTGAEDPDAPADRTITVDATGSADAAPDQAVVHVVATAEGDDPAEVRDQLASNADALRQNLDDAGVDEGDYETAEYHIREPHGPPDEREGAAYRGVHAFEVTVDDPEKVGDVIDAAADANAEVGTVRFTLSEERRTELREDAIRDAMSDARTQAGIIADSGDLQVTSVASVDASQQNYRPVRYEAAAGGGGDGAQTALETGEVSVSYDVRVTYNATAG